MPVYVFMHICVFHGSYFSDNSYAFYFTIALWMLCHKLNMVYLYLKPNEFSWKEECSKHTFKIMQCSTWQNWGIAMPLSMEITPVIYATSGREYFEEDCFGGVGILNDFYFYITSSVTF